MRVEKFSLFFPRPPLKTRGETEYAIGAIPAGGYVKITGMNPSEDLPDEVRTRAYHAQPVWKRIVVIAAGPAVNLVLAFLLMFVFFAAIGAETEPKRAQVDVVRGTSPPRGSCARGTDRRRRQQARSAPHALGRSPRTSAPTRLQRRAARRRSPRPADPVDAVGELKREVR